MQTPNGCFDMLLLEERVLFRASNRDKNAYPKTQVVPIRMEDNQQRYTRQNSKFIKLSILTCSTPTEEEDKDFFNSLQAAMENILTHVILVHGVFNRMMVGKELWEGKE